MEILSIITERPDRLAAHDVGCLPTKRLEHRQKQLQQRGRSTWTAHYGGQRWKKKKKKRRQRNATNHLWIMNESTVQCAILGSHASVIRSGPVTWSRYSSSIGHSLFTGDLHRYRLASKKINHLDWTIQGSCTGLSASYSGVKTSAAQYQHGPNRGWALWRHTTLSRRYPISWPERQPLATGNSYTVSSFLQTGGGKKSISLYLVPRFIWSWGLHNKLYSPTAACAIYVSTHLIWA